MVLQVESPFAPPPYLTLPWLGMFGGFSDQFVGDPFTYRAGIHSNPGTHYGKPPKGKSTWYTEIPIEDESDDSSDEEDIYSIDVRDPTAMNKPWIPSLHLSTRDMLELRTGEQLSDKHIYAAQKLLQNQFPGIEGMQDTCLSQTSFQPVCRDMCSLQIHHTRGSHWVLSYTSGEDGIIRIYDSLYSSVSKDLKQQLSQIYGNGFRTKRGYLHVSQPEVQDQKGIDDCALFVIAFAFELCQGNDPSNCVFKQSKMRRHLFKCFRAGELRSFPHTYRENVNREDREELLDCWLTE